MKLPQIEKGIPPPEYSRYSNRDRSTNDRNAAGTLADRMEEGDSILTHNLEFTRRLRSALSSRGFTYRSFHYPDGGIRIWKLGAKE